MAAVGAVPAPLGSRARGAEVVTTYVCDCGKRFSFLTLLILHQHETGCARAGAAIVAAPKERSC